MTKITICSVLPLLLSLFMIWAIWHLVSKQKDGETTSTTALPFTTTTQQEISELSSTLSPVEPIEDITTDSPIWPEFTLPPDLPTEFETISVITKGEALPQSSQSVEDTSSTPGQLSKVTPQESSTITTPSTRAAPPKPTVPSTFAIDEQMTTKLPEKEKSTFPEEETVTPYVEPTFPDEETVTPYKEITLPQETSTSHVVHTSPSSEHTSIRHELSTKPQTSPESTKPSDISTTTTKLTTEPLIDDTSLPTFHIVKPTEPPTEPPTTIKSPYLIKYERELSKSLNLSGDPCDNFFDFVCDNFPYQYNIFYKSMDAFDVTLDAAMQQVHNQSYNHTAAMPYPIAVKMITDIYFECVDDKQGHLPNEHLHNSTVLPKVKTECMDIVFEGHTLVCYRLYVDYHSGGVKSSSYMSESIEKAHELATFKKASFRKNIEEHITWLDDETRQKVLLKLDRMPAMIGFPKIVLDDAFLNYIYRINNNYYPDYFDYFAFTWAQKNEELREAKSNVIKRIISLKEFRYQPYAKWATELSIWETGGQVGLSAHYLRGINSLTIPIHQLKLPVFDLQFPAFYNFAMLGKTVGHEMAHGFDRIGSKYNENGILGPIWTKGTRAHFEEQAQCFVEQYAKLCVVDRWPTMMDGALTVDENIADNGALKITYYALKRYKQSGGRVNEPYLFEPNVQALSTEQLFFIASAQSYCHKRPEKEEDLKRYVNKRHSPFWHRVNVPLCNFDRFAQAFQCDASSRMNCSTKCVIW